MTIFREEGQSEKQITIFEVAFSAILRPISFHSNLRQNVQQVLDLMMIIVMDIMMIIIMIC